MSRTQWNAAIKNTPVLTVDAVIKLERQGIVFVRRRNPPFQHWWALPGGMVEIGETVEEALVREVEEETGLQVHPFHLIGVFSNPTRDPRGHTVSIAFQAEVLGGTIKAGSDAIQVKLFQTWPKQIAFDHRLILEQADVF